MCPICCLYVCWLHWVSWLHLRNRSFSSGEQVKVEKKNKKTLIGVRPSSYITLQSEGEKSTQFGVEGQLKEKDDPRKEEHQGSSAGKHLWWSELSLEKNVKGWFGSEWESVARGEALTLHQWPTRPTQLVERFTLEVYALHNKTINQLKKKCH